MNRLDLLISEQEIKKKLAQISLQLDADYQGEELTLLMIMKGAICLGADLIRLLKVPTRMEYLSASSYGSGGTERGALHVENLDKLDVRGKHILLIDDIYHTGHTINHILSSLKKHQPKSIKSLVLLLKEESRESAYIPEYFLFKVGKPFVVGYGMDYKEHYRGLTGIYTLTG